MGKTQAVYRTPTEPPQTGTGGFVPVLLPETWALGLQDESLKVAPEATVYLLLLAVKELTPPGLVMPRPLLQEPAIVSPGWFVSEKLAVHICWMTIAGGGGFVVPSGFHLTLTVIGPEQSSTTDPVSPITPTLSPMPPLQLLPP